MGRIGGHPQFPPALSLSRRVGQQVVAMTRTFHTAAHAESRSDGSDLGRLLSAWGACQ